jgi:hypothetical protein
MYRFLLISIALIGCSPEGEPAADHGLQNARGLPDKMTPDEELDPIGRHRALGAKQIKLRTFGGQEGEPVWDGALNGSEDIDSDGTTPEPPPPPPSPIDTGDTGLP